MYGDRKWMQINHVEFKPLDTTAPVFNERSKPFNYAGRWYDRNEMQKLGLDYPAHVAILEYYSK